MSTDSVDTGPVDTGPVDTGPVDTGLGAPQGAVPLRHLRRRLRRFRRWVGFGVLLLPTAWMLWGEVVRRGPAIVDFPTKYKFSYAGGVAQSLIFWGLLLYVAAKRRRRFSGLVAGLYYALFVVILGAEAAFHAFWNVYLCIDGQIHSKNVVQAIVGTLPMSRPLVLFHFALAAVVGAATLVWARRFVRPRKWPYRVAVVLLPIALAGSTQLPVSYRGIQASPPDALYVHGMTALIKEQLDLTNESPDLRVQRRKPEPVPQLKATPSKHRNVLLILQESQRGDVICAAPDRRCDLSTPWSNAAAPNRMPLLQLRANASTTAISISNIWSGVDPTESRELLHSVPLMWEYAAAAGFSTGYWTSQNLMFGNARQYIQDLPLTRGCVATHLDSQADLDAGANDELVTERVKQEFGDLKEPFFAVVHYSNVHFPYVHEDSLAPLQPSIKDHSPAKNDVYFNYYRNVVYRSDLAVGELIRHIRSTPSGKNTVIVYTADHGESFREHWQMGHTSSIYDEEVLVKGWIDAPSGTLTDEERKNIEGARNELVWHLDLPPTFLDLMGLWDTPEMAPFRARMLGSPITRKERTVRPLPMTNCTWVWECSFRNWGMMQGPLKAEAREWDGSFHCFDVLKDPEERIDLGERGCGSLPDLARQKFHAMPNVTPPGRPKVDWGK